MLAIGAFVLMLLLGVVYYVVRPDVSRYSHELPVNFPNDGFSHTSFEELLLEYVEEGLVNYQRWHDTPKDRRKLKRYLGAVAALSPDNAPQRFANASAQTAYWMYAYNALVIDAILDRWPIESVTDVKAPIEVVQGLGFFYKLKFTLGGEVLSLYELEHQKILARTQDPRVHFVLNCGSGGCPIMRPRLPTGEELEPYLAAAAADFVGDKKNVTFDHQKKILKVSKIFSWYKEDFLNELRRQGQSTGRGIVDYLKLVATGEMSLELERARDYTVEMNEYDWALNKTKEKE